MEKNTETLKGGVRLGAEELARVKAATEEEEAATPEQKIAELERVIASLSKGHTDETIQWYEQRVARLIQRVRDLERALQSPDEMIVYIQTMITDTISGLARMIAVVEQRTGVTLLEATDEDIAAAKTVPPEDEERISGELSQKFGLTAPNAAPVPAPRHVVPPPPPSGPTSSRSRPDGGGYSFGRGKTERPIPPPRPRLKTLMMGQPHASPTPSPAQDEMEVTIDEDDDVPSRPTGEYFFPPTAVIKH